MSSRRRNPWVGPSQPDLFKDEDTRQFVPIDELPEDYIPHPFDYTQDEIDEMSDDDIEELLGQFPDLEAQAKDVAEEMAGRFYIDAESMVDSYSYNWDFDHIIQSYADRYDLDYDQVAELAPEDYAEFHYDRRDYYGDDYTDAIMHVEIDPRTFRDWADRLDHNPFLMQAAIWLANQPLSDDIEYAEFVFPRDTFSKYDNDWLQEEFDVGYVYVSMGTGFETAVEELASEEEEDEESEEPTLVKKWPGGWEAYDLPAGYLSKEGRSLGHCVGQRQYGYGEGIRNKELKIFSIRKKGTPMFTIEAKILGGGLAYEGLEYDVAQVKGKGNRLPGTSGGGIQPTMKEVEVVMDFVRNSLKNDPEEVYDLRPAIRVEQGMTKLSNPSDWELNQHHGPYHCGFCNKPRR